MPFKPSTNIDIIGPFQRVLSTKVEIKMDSKWDDSVYMGPPSKDLDNAWHKLQEGMYYFEIRTY